MNQPAEDDAAVAAVLGEAAKGKPWGWGYRYRIGIATVLNHRVDLSLDSGSEQARVWLALPSSGRPMPWTQSSSPTPRGWVGDLADWLNEEMDTVGLGPAVINHPDDAGVHRVVVDGYGFRLADPARHAELHRVVGPRGWGGERGRRQIRRAYALEWALDEVEQLLDYRHKARRAGTEWTLTSPDGLSIVVEATDATPDQVDQLLTAKTRSRWAGQTSTRLRSRP